ncbi:MAG: tRNA epoxyqueuosine(34) reductase QueG [Bacteroidia bacterium]|jgi:epoxyqueuosine reductase
MTQAELLAHERAHVIKNLAAEFGFMYCGISKAGPLDDEARKLEQWLNKGMHGKMRYMENYFDKRINPTLLVEGAKSVITLLFNYYTPEKQKDPESPKISRYAYGEDYHKVIKSKLFDLMNRLSNQFGSIAGRAFVDSAPVMDKAWAVRSGAGWMGKNTNVIRPQAGSWFFIAELIIDLDLQADGPIKDYCGSCTRCIDACPTEALTPYTIDANKCISYLTIELRDAIADSFQRKMDNWMFGCDVCQEVCPWNRFAEKHHEPLFEPHPDLLNLTKEDWEDLSYDVFTKVLGKSAVERAGFDGLKRTIQFLK